jgi:hypothetical protein
MKICPQCDQIFNDDNLNFCLMDGTPLVSGESQPTVVIPSAGVVETVVMPRASDTVAVPKKGSNTVWIVVAVASLTALVVAVIGGGFLFYRYSGKDANTVGNRNGVVIASPTPKATTPKVSPSPTVPTGGDPSPTAGETRSTPETSEADEVVPIAWNTTANTFKQDAGRTYTFDCPKGGEAAAVWGSDVYAAISSICTAAVHAGVITLDGGGSVTIEFRPARSVYGSTTRNGITTITLGEDISSFVVRKAAN